MKNTVPEIVLESSIAQLSMGISAVFAHPAQSDFHSFTLHNTMGDSMILKKIYKLKILIINMR